MASQFVAGANFRCALHHLLSLTRWNGSRAKFGREATENGRNLNYNVYFLA
jgi:hypothetical protein